MLLQVIRKGRLFVVSLISIVDMVIGTRANPQGDRDDPYAADTPMDPDIQGMDSEGAEAQDHFEESTWEAPTDAGSVEPTSKNSEALEKVSTVLERIETILSTLSNAMACMQEGTTPQNTAFARNN